MTDPTSKPDFRSETQGKRAPRAVADAVNGTIIATADVGIPPARVFELFTSSEVESWWGHPDFYRWTDWQAELCERGPWSVTVRLANGAAVRAWGEFAAIEAPRRLVMTRRFDQHPFQGEREITLSYFFEPAGEGTRITVREEGYLGRREAAYGNAEHWERVLGWLDAYASSHG